MSNRKLMLLSTTLSIVTILNAACGSLLSTFTNSPTVAPTVTLTATQIRMTEIPATAPIPTSTPFPKDPTNYVVQLDVSECQYGKGSFRHLTGFFVEGKQGIVTALHGIVDCRDKSRDPQGCIRAQVSEPFVAGKPEQPSREYDCLTVSEVYVDGDVVVLASEELTMDRQTIWPRDGLDVDTAPLPNGSCGQFPEFVVRAYGFPGEYIALKKRLPTVLCRVSLIDILGGGIDHDAYRAMQVRGSPLLRANVTFLEMTHAILIPGWSGSPIIRASNNLLVGVVLGGVPNSELSDPTSWAAPWVDIPWQSPTDEIVRSRLDRLAQQEIPMARSMQVLFGYEQNFTSEIDAASLAAIEPWLRVPNNQIWQGDLDAYIYAPIDLCVVIYTDQFYSKDKIMLSQTQFQKGTLGIQPISMKRLPETSANDYRRFCQAASSHDSITLYANILELNSARCGNPYTTGNGPVFTIFELDTRVDIWDTGFCADPDIEFR